MMQRHNRLIIVLLALFFTAACRDNGVPTQAPTAAPPEALATAAVNSSGAVQPTVANPTAAPPTPVPPTPTPTEPMAAKVNNRPVFLSKYEKELARYEQAQAELGLTPGEGVLDYRVVVLDALIEMELISEAAEANGITVTPEAVDERLAELVETSGGAANFESWLQANQWTQDEFREALAAEMLTEKTVAFVTADVPEAVEQVHARYIQVDDAALAQSLVDQARNGADFAALAQQHSLDRITGESGGDLGFFARGSLLVPEVEAAAFALQPGQISDVITATGVDGTGTTYYLVQVIERDPQRQLTADLRFAMLQEKFEAWLAELWAQAAIERYVDTSA